MGLGTGVSFFKVILYFALMLLAMCLLTLPFISPSSPGFVVIVIALIINSITVAGAWIYLRIMAKKN